MADQRAEGERPPGTVESARRALLDPRGWPTIVAGSTRSVVDAVRGRRPVPSLRPAGGRNGLPADLLVAPDGRVVASKYGTHVDDQWSVDELLELARAQIADGATARPRPHARP